MGHQHGVVALLPGAVRVPEVPCRAASRGCGVSAAWPGGAEPLVAGLPCPGPAVAEARGPP